jgi:hypothetical protein
VEKRQRDGVLGGVVPKSSVWLVLIYRVITMCSVLLDNSRLSVYEPALSS